MDKKTFWYGYVHGKDDEIEVKPFICEDQFNRDREDAFIWRVWGPFEAKDRKEALEITKNFVESEAKK